MNASFWSGVQVSVQTALSIANTITGITLANPAVATYSGSDPANGDIVLFAVSGMPQLNGTVRRVANVNTTANTFEIEGLDSTLFGAFSSGSFQTVTLGKSMTNIIDVSPSGGDPEFKDLTTIHDSSIRKQVPVIAGPLTFAMTGLFDPSDPAMAELFKATQSLTTRVFRFVFSNGQRILFNGFVSATGVPTGAAQDSVQTPISIAVQGLPTAYAS